eukprot:scaffold597_cov176-Amphora_coffeaeformis.AAC.32
MDLLPIVSLDPSRLCGRAVKITGAIQVKDIRPPAPNAGKKETWCWCRVAKHNTNPRSAETRVCRKEYSASRPPFSRHGRRLNNFS